MNLPFQVVGQRCTTATLLLATTFSTLAKRPEEHKPLDCLVLDHVSDTTLNAICNNHMDVSNAVKVFSSLTSLMLSIKRQEVSNTRQELFTKHLWFLIRKAVNLESLCLIGWNVKRNINTRMYSSDYVGVGDWMMRSLPYTIDGSFQLSKLRYLELKRVDIHCGALLDLITESSKTLKEIYLHEVFMKVRGTTSSEKPLWIGHAHIPKSADTCWLAPALRDLEGLQLDVLRVTCLGYDDFDREQRLGNPLYDLQDPTGRNRSFDERFVEAVCASEEILSLVATEALALGPPPLYDAELPYMGGVGGVNHGQGIILPPSRPSNIPATEYDAETYQREIRNPTSHLKRCIDGYFFNHNEQALKELQNIISVADRGMNIISEEINRSRQLHVDDATGRLEHDEAQGG